MLVIAHGVVTAATAVVVAGRAAGSPTTAGVEVRTAVSPRPSTPPTSVTVGEARPAPAEAPATSRPEPATSAAPALPRPCAQLQALSPRAKLAQLLFVGVTDAGTAKATMSGPNPAGGLLVLGKGSTWFANGVLRAIAASAAVAPVVAADEEGGRVQRIDALHGSMPSATVLGGKTPAEVRAIAGRRGSQLKELGFTMDLAPVIDLYDGGNAVIKTRAFSPDPAKVVTYGDAFADGLVDAGITPVLKHFPGHGRSTGDSHKQAVRTPPLAELRQTDLKPFQALAGSVPAVMVGHLDVPGLTTAGRPASVSPEAIGGLLRQEIGFKGLVVTDDLSGMKAITDRFTVSEAVLASLVAGADVAIVTLSTGQTLAPLLASLERAVADGRLPMARVNEALDHLAPVKPSCR